jgi:hypothetical protein
MVRIFGQKNMTKFKEMMLNHSLEGFFKLITVLLKHSIKYTMMHITNVFPLKRLSVKRSKDKKWISSGIKISIINKDRLFKKFTLKPNIENKNTYNKYKNILTSCIRKAEELYVKELINSEQNNLYSLWKIFGSIINPKKIKVKNCISELIVNNKKKITNKTDIAIAFNDHFSTVGERLANKINTN